MLVFVYGSLLHPRSLQQTVPDVDLDACQPARLRGWQRCFDLAFPNDGSQPDKAFFDSDGDRPPWVLLANLRRESTGGTLNGVLVEVSDTALGRLRRRERRYRLRTLSGPVECYDGEGPVIGSVLTALGRAEFQSPEAVTAGVVARDYVAGILAGVRHWARRTAGFAEDFYGSTVLPAPERIAELERVDLS